MRKNIMVDSKKALFLNGKRITEYIYNAFYETEEEVILYNERQLAIYSKETGKKLYEYERTVFKSTIWCEVYKNCIKIDNGDKYFLVKSDGSIISDKLFDYCRNIRYKGGELIEVTIDGKKGMYDFDAKEVIPVIYDSLSINSKDVGYICVKNNNKKGLYDLKGKVIIDTIYDEIYVYDNCISAYNYDQNSQHVYSKMGKHLVEVDNKDAYAKYNKLGILIDDHKNSIVSLYSNDGKLILKDYEKIIVGDSPNYEVIIAKKNGMYGLFDYSGNELLPCIYSKISMGGTLKSLIGVVFLHTHVGRYSLYSLKEKEIILPFDNYSEVISYKDKICEIVTEDGRHGFYFCEYEKFIMADEMNITKTGKFEFLIDGEWIMRKYI